MKKIVIITIISLLLCLSIQAVFAQKESRIWQVQSIDTMKYSRDLAREKLKDNSFDQVIETQIKNIAETGATHVAIGTPYDEEFFPILLRWVRSARKFRLNVWFRGNFSGWEKWFGYSSISRQEHIDKTKGFILRHKDLFVDGDIFSPCIECENGGPGDPRRTGDTVGFRKFLVDEYRTTKAAFKEINKNVRSNFYSMNGDIANLVMDRETTEGLDNIVVIDHYVSSVDRFIKDIDAISEKSGGKIFLGEIGAPIPDIHGQFTDKEQADFLKSALSALSANKNVIGLNYWVNVGGSTELWKNDKPRPAVEILKSYFVPTLYSGKILNEIGKPIDKAKISIGGKYTYSDSQGEFKIFYPGSPISARIFHEEYVPSEVILVGNSPKKVLYISKVNESRIFRILKVIYRIFVLHKLQLSK